MIMLKTDRRDGTAVQVVYALTLTVVVGLTLWWGFVRENAPLGASGIRVEADFTAMRDGPAPDHFDGGQPATMVVSPDDPGDQLRIHRGGLTYQPTTRGAAAAYFSSPDLGSSVKNMGARFVFRPGSGTTSAIGLAVSRGGVEKRVPPMLGSLSIHFVVTPINWNISVSRTENSPLELVAADSFPQPLRQDGQTVYEAHLTIDGDQVTLDLPQTHRIVKDPRFSEWQGSFVTFELFSNHGATDSIGAFEKIWATGKRD